MQLKRLVIYGILVMGLFTGLGSGSPQTTMMPTLHQNLSA